MTDMDEQNNSTANYYVYDEYGDDYAPSNGSAMEFGKVFLPTLYSLVFILGIIGNGLVVCVLIIHHNQTNLTDICLFNLALADLLFVLSMPFYSHNAAVGQWIFGDFMCRLVNGFYSIGFYSSIFSMLAMTLDRYALVVHAHTVARHRTLRMGAVLTLAIWMLSFVISLPTLVFTQVKNESGLEVCDLDPDNYIWKEYKILATNIVGLVVPLLVMGFCYSRIIPTLINMKTVKKHRIVKMIIIIVVIYFCFWTPYNIVLFLKFLTPQDQWETDENMKLSIQVTEAIAFTHCCLNPIIYAFAGQKFMQRVLKLLRVWLPWCFPHRHPSRDFSETTVRKSSVMSKSVTSTFM